MATRLYVHTTTGLGWTVAPSASWDITAGYSQRLLTTILDADAALSSSVANAKAEAGTKNILVCQFVLPYLTAQTISGTLKGQARVSESNVAADAHVQTVVRVVDPVTGTSRGTLWAATASGAISGTAGTDNYEMSTTSTNRKVPSGWSGSGVSLTSVDAEAGDWLVIEVGARYFEAAATSRTFTFFTARSAADVDYAEDETTTGTDNTWLEFSADIATAPRAEPFDFTTLEVPQRFPDLQAPPPSEGQTWPRGGGSW